VDLTPFATATDIAAAIRAGQVRSRDVLEMYLDRCAGPGAALNAVVTIDADQARRTADACDRAVANGAVLGPLHGVPMTVKDAFATAGMRSTSGMQDLADDVPSDDAVVVARLRAAGAVIFGKTNVPPGITGQETANSIFGRTVNPWDPRRTCGGSSGGAAAAVAAGLTAAEVGSDSGGSVRQPAHCCGVFGHVPTHGVVPLRGHRPQVPFEHPGKDVDLMDIGPLARSVDDLSLLLGVLSGDDPANGGGMTFAFRSAKPIEQLRVAVWADDAHCPSSAEVAAGVHMAGERLRARGANVVDDVRPRFSMEHAWEVAFRLWVAASSVRTDDEEFERLSKLADAPGQADCLGLPGPSAPLVRAQAETMSHRDWLRLDEKRRELQDLWREFLERFDVVLCPVIPVVAPLHDRTEDLDAVASVDHRMELAIDVDGTPRPYLDQLTWNIVTGIAGLPATSAPVVQSDAGLPVGVQIVAARYADPTCLAVARVVGRFTPCSG
jgi:amidase